MTLQDGHQISTPQKRSDFLGFPGWWPSGAQISELVTLGGIHGHLVNPKSWKSWNKLGYHDISCIHHIIQATHQPFSMWKMTKRCQRTLPETNSSHLKVGAIPKRKGSYSKHHEKQGQAVRLRENKGNVPFDLFSGRNQWLFLVPLKGGRWHIIPQLAVYTTYILPSGGLYATYHLLREPETTIEETPKTRKTTEQWPWVSRLFAPDRNCSWDLGWLLSGEPTPGDVKLDYPLVN